MMRAASSSPCAAIHGVSRRALLLAGLVWLAGVDAGCAQAQTVPPPGPGMRASVTYLNLLAKVPMFRGMSNEQLQWVIDHSREWVVEPGAEVASSTRGADRFWTLLDGGWRIEQGSRVVAAGHADSAKWFGGRDWQALSLAPTRVVATARSYVMEIDPVQLDEMLRRGLPLKSHLDAGLAFYRTLSH